MTEDKLTRLAICSILMTMRPRNRRRGCLCRSQNPALRRTFSIATSSSSAAAAWGVSIEIGVAIEIKDVLPYSGNNGSFTTVLDDGDDE